MEKKICTKCNEEKVVTEFNKNKRIPDGLSRSCKTCRSIERKESRGTTRIYRRDHHKREWESNELFRLKYSICPQLRKCVRKWVKGGSGYTDKSRLYEIIGCSFDYFTKHLENQFEDWMTKENYGNYNGEFNHGWDIDHIIPLSSARDVDHFIELCHYTNVRPLCSKQNRDIVKNVNKDLVN
jgi:hypothetical protein